MHIVAVPASLLPILYACTPPLTLHACVPSPALPCLQEVDGGAFFCLQFSSTTSTEHHQH